MVAVTFYFEPGWHASSVCIFVVRCISHATISPMFECSTPLFFLTGSSASASAIVARYVSSQLSVCYLPCHVLKSMCVRWDVPEPMMFFALCTALRAVTLHRLSATHWSAREFALLEYLMINQTWASYSGSPSFWEEDVALYANIAFYTHVAMLVVMVQ
jgi:hypothetical protein